MLAQSLGGEWSNLSLARELGESGPHYLAANGDTVAVALNTSDAARILWPGPTAATGAPSTPVEGRILTLRAGNAGFTALTSSAAGVHQLSGERGALVDGGAMSLRADSISGAVPVAGAWGQSLLLGRHSAQLLDETSGPTVRI